MRHRVHMAVNRRELLRLGAVSTVAGAIGGARSGSAAGPPRQPAKRAPAAALHTPLCDLLGIRYPILQAPMAGVVTPELIAEVAKAGGLGILPGTGMPPEELRRQIRRIRELTDQSFGVNLILHPSVRTPLRPEQIADDTMSAIQAALNPFRRRLGLPPGASRAPALSATMVDDAFGVILDERVPLFSVGVGKPTPEMVARCRAQGTKVVSMIATVPDAVEVAGLGVDLIIAQGGEAGGHRSTWIKRPSSEMAAIGTMVLVPQVVDAVRVPLVAAGGITTGRQVAAAFVLGASGVLMGTRFIAARESAAPEFYTRALVQQDSDATTVTDAFTGLFARVLRNTFTEEYRTGGAPVIPAVQQAIVGDITRAAAQRGDGELYPMYAGQGVGMIRDVPAATAIVETVVAEAEQALRSMARRVEMPSAGQSRNSKASRQL